MLVQKSFSVFSFKSIIHTSSLGAVLVCHRMTLWWQFLSWATNLGIQWYPESGVLDAVEFALSERKPSFHILCHFRSGKEKQASLGPQAGVEDHGERGQGQGLTKIILSNLISRPVRWQQPHLQPHEETYTVTALHHWLSECQLAVECQDIVIGFNLDNVLQNADWWAFSYF